MTYGDWQPTMQLRYIRSYSKRVLQQMWSRTTSEYRTVAGKERHIEGAEHEWREIPLVKASTGEST